MDIINLDKNSSWQSSFTFDHVKCLIVCRGPIRLEAMKIFEKLKAKYGILISEKDSIIFPNTLAPELHYLSNRSEQAHHIVDYMGKTNEEKVLLIEKIIKICNENKYTHIFAGYGFMAEDSEFVSKIENVGLSFIGPNSKIIRHAGSKDEAKKLARSLKVPVIPGEDSIDVITLLGKAGRNPRNYFRKIIKKHKLDLPQNWESLTDFDQANALLKASYLKRVDLFSISDLQKETTKIVENLLEKNPGRRIRLKHVLGGGGKGQRVVNSVEQVPEAVMSVLIESKTNGVGDNKNFLIELNIENSRHIEIQLIGNGKWCKELGGRDCSLQMHEQKLVEISLTEEMLKLVAKEYMLSGKKTQSSSLINDAKMLNAMCIQAEKFGEALNLDSVSTFECIVDNEKYYFMEVNTRIQVEHRVTEMAYKLQFTNPDNPDDTFTVDSLVASMILIKCYGESLQPPKRIPRYISGIEARINATNASLNPYAGGTVFDWTAPIEGEIRDDQGISTNHSGEKSLTYHLAGAYDSNIALSITGGISQKESFENLIEILRQMDVRGQDLHLNIDFLYGMLHWFIGHDPMLKPNTNFVSSYLALAGKMKNLCDQLNLKVAWDLQLSQVKNNYGLKGIQICEQKSTLLLRPLEKLFNNTHLMMGWLAFQKSSYNLNTFFELENPINILEGLYHYLNLNHNSKKNPFDQIWSHDQKILEKASGFYNDLLGKFGQVNLIWTNLNSLLKSEIPPKPFNSKKNLRHWDSILKTHKEHQIGMELLNLPIIMAKEVGYYKLKGNNDLEVEIPEEFLDFESNEDLIARLSPTQISSSNKILAWTGGIFYSRETPDANDYVKDGQQVEKGQVLGLLEVMKMFNKIRAKFSGKIIKKCVGDGSGVLVTKGQSLFIIEPDIQPKTRKKEQIYLDQKKQTTNYMQKIFSTG